MSLKLEIIDNFLSKEDLNQLQSLKFKETEFIQYLFLVGNGPSSKT